MPAKKFKIKNFLKRAQKTTRTPGNRGNLLSLIKYIYKKLTAAISTMAKH
jgi:hypothetical protein